MESTEPQDPRRSADVVGPDGVAYRIRCRRRGEPFTSWDGADTAFGPLDLVVFVVSLLAKVVTVARVRSSHGWTVGVLTEGAVRTRVVHREHVENEQLLVPTVLELSRQAERGAYTS